MNESTHRTLESLAELRLPDLQEHFAELVGEPTRSPNKTFLLRRIGEVLAARERETATVAEPAAANTLSTPADTPSTSETASTKVRLTKLSVRQLQAMYREVIGRETRPSSSTYLVWKLRQAEKGRIPLGPIQGRGAGEATDIKVLPLRLTTAEVTALDEAWRRLGFKSRTAMIRRAIENALASPQT